MTNVKSRHLAVAIVGFIIIALTFCLYFLLDIERTTLQNWAFSFVVLAEFLFFIGLDITISSTKLFNDALSRAGMISLLSLYLLAMLVAMPLSGWFADTQRPLFLTFISIQGVFIILLVLLLHVSYTFLETGKVLRQKTMMMDNAERTVYGLLLNSESKTYASLLTRVYEQIKYADKIGTSSKDADIVEKIAILKENSENNNQDDTTLTGTIEQLSILLQQRKEELSKLKRGGF